ncbi:MAG: choice-of-anchor X domain-containing protein, partial [Bacteroidota bacterium]
MSVKTYAAVEHEQGSQSILAVNARIFDESSFSPLGSALLKDDGSEVDSTKDDGIFSGVLTFGIRRSDVGRYKVEINAENPNGFKSNTRILTLLIVRENHPPSLSNLQAPDTVRLSAQVPSILLTVRASDSDGLADIRQVTFNSFLPSGQPSSGNPFRMYDDGTNGDTLSGDGIYSLRIAPP